MFAGAASVEVEEMGRRALEDIGYSTRCSEDGDGTNHIALEASRFAVGCGAVTGLGLALALALQ